jgi:hypothetical protein
MQDNSRYADTSQAREVDAGSRERGYDPFHPDNPDLTDCSALKQRQQAEDESRRARMAIAMGQLEAFFGARP